MPSTAIWERRTTERLQRALALSLLAGVFGFGLVLVAFIVSFAWPDDAIATPATHHSVGKVDDFEIGEPRYFADGAFWLVRLDEQHAVALFATDPKGTALSTTGCTVPWRENFSFTDPRTGAETRGWFRNPCGGQTYDLAGVCVFGPCLRSLDRYPVTIAPNGNIVVITSPQRLMKGPPPCRPTLTSCRP